MITPSEELGQANFIRLATTAESTPPDIPTSNPHKKGMLYQNRIGHICISKG